MVGLTGPANCSFIVSNNGSTTAVNVSDTGNVTANSGGYLGPGGIALDPTDEFLYVTNFNNGNGQTVSSVSAAGGTPVTFISSSAGLRAPVAVTTDSAGNVYVVDSGNLRIAKFDSTGNIINANFITGLSNPIRGVDLDSSGDVFVTDGTTFREYTSAGGNTPTLTVSGFSLAFGIALGTDSLAAFALVSDASQNKVYEVNLSDGTKTQYNTSGVSLSAPTGLTFDALGDLFVTDDGNNTISEITPGGVTSTFATTGLALNGPVGIVFTGGQAAAPEPSSLVLSGLGVVMAYAFSRRRRPARVGFDTVTLAENTH